MPVYIQGSSFTVPSVDSSDIRDWKSDRVKWAGENDYAECIEPGLIRRMSRILRFCITTAKRTLSDAEMKVVDAIVTGTGYGCQEDTATFLQKMIEGNEVGLSPTPFMLSTHNTIGSQIALLLQCRGYNQTYTQDALSFEHALIDAQMLLHEPGINHVLVGGFDELTGTGHGIMKRFGALRNQKTSEIYSDRPNIQFGEGAGFVVLGHEPVNQNNVILKDVEVFFRPLDESLNQRVNDFLERNHVTVEKLDIILSGECGVPKFDRNILHWLTNHARITPALRFKEFCGEFSTASSFAMVLACEILCTDLVPEFLGSFDVQRSPKNILVINQYMGEQYSLILLQK